MHDIASRADIESFLGAFYEKAITDEVIGHHFADLDLAAHLPVIADFWEKVLFGNPVYFNNPLVVHQKLHEKFPLKPEHFLHWVGLFSQTIDRLFAGEIAEYLRTNSRMTFE